jgi:hypothetical protein
MAIDLTSNGWLDLPAMAAPWPHAAVGHPRRDRHNGDPDPLKGSGNLRVTLRVSVTITDSEDCRARSSGSHEG